MWLSSGVLILSTASAQLATPLVESQQLKIAWMRIIGQYIWHSGRRVPDRQASPSVFSLAIVSRSIDSERSVEALSSSLLGTGNMKTKDIYKQPGHLIRRAHQLSTAAFMSEVDALGLTPVQFSALIVVREYPGIDASRVSELIFFDRSTIGNVLDRLEKKKLVLRKPGLEDRRTKRLFLTEKGQVAINKIAERTSEISGRILAPLSAQERKLFVQLLERLIKSKLDN
jgi:DNA-binding MarR family transcriptional regulator